MATVSLYPCLFDLQFRHDYSASIYKVDLSYIYKLQKIFLII